MATYALPAGVMCALSSERREACILPSGHAGRCSWARCTKFAGYRDGQVWECTRERGHDGPCAAVAAVCGATWDFYVTDHTLTTYSVTCTLPRGHELDHRGEIGWPS